MTNFPTSLPDSTAIPVGGSGSVTGSVSKSSTNMRAELIAVATKVGVDSSAVTSTLDYKATHRSFHADFYTAGSLVATTGALRWYNDTGVTLTFEKVRLSVGTVATGTIAGTPVTNAAIVAGVNVDGTTIFTTGNSANRPNLAVSTATGTFTTFATATIATGHYLTADIVWASAATSVGADLGLQVWMVG